MKALIISLLTLGVVNSQTPDCRNFRTGKFELFAPESNVIYVIERFDGYQVEMSLDAQTRKSVAAPKYLTIVWDSDCEYRLFPDSVRARLDEFDRDVINAGGLRSRILKTNVNCAVVQTFLFGDSYKSDVCKVE